MAPPTRRQLLHSSFIVSLNTLADNGPAFSVPMRSSLSHQAAALYTGSMALLTVLTRQPPPPSIALSCIVMVVCSLATRWLSETFDEANQSLHYILQSWHDGKIADLFTKYMAKPSHRYLTEHLPRGRREWRTQRFEILFNEPESIFMHLVGDPSISFIAFTY